MRETPIGGQRTRIIDHFPLFGATSASYHVRIRSPAAGKDVKSRANGNLWMVTYVFTQGSISSNPNNQSTPDTFPAASPNCGYNARGETTVPPFMAENMRKIWRRLAFCPNLRIEP